MQKVEVAGFAQRRRGAEISRSSPSAALRLCARSNSLVTALFVLAGCEVGSRIDPEVPLAELQPGEDAQLCRFTADVLAGTDAACVSFARDFDACLVAPPWAACAPGERAADVGSWEDCVRASRDCAADADVCWHVACR